MIVTTPRWPAPPAPPTLEQQRRCVRAVYGKPSSKSLPITAKTVPAAKATKFEGRLFGRALTFGKWATPSGLYADGDRPVRALIAEGALTAFIRRVRAGKEHVALRVDHDPHRELCSTRDGSLDIEVDGKSLLFRVMPSIKAGRSAIRAARDLKYYEASTLIHPTTALTSPDGDILVLEGTLEEISLVLHGAFPGTAVTII